MGAGQRAVAALALRLKTKPPRPTASDTYSRIYAVVRRIPRGKVATYGQVAALAGLPGHARQVGYALHVLSATTSVPWHRVVNASGEVSRRVLRPWEELQRRLLEKEGVSFDGRGRIELRRERWRPQSFATRLSVRREPARDRRARPPVRA
ncbi:MAG TPA: MGMT family protein [Candidatus Bathyarchaeia archaeon]|nr:MGMT family protein [Candidatus Bathyarchaeia archaeon]